MRIPTPIHINKNDIDVKFFEKIKQKHVRIARI